jgi:hypothetical protein
VCQPAVCKQCGKATWRGCGMHVDQVMAGVPKAAQCTCERGGGGGLVGAIKGLFGRG